MMKTDEFETEMKWRGKNEKNMISELSGYLGWQRWRVWTNQGLFVKSSFLPNRIGTYYLTIAAFLSFPLSSITK